MIGGVPLTADIVFKYVFGSDQSAAVLRSFLSAVQIDAGFPPVESVEIRNPFNLQNTSEDKVSIVDVRARDATGRVYTVEVQAERRIAFAERSLYYWARTYGAQLGKGDRYEHLDPVVGVNVLDFVFLPEDEPMHSTFSLRSRSHPDLGLTDDLILHYLELPKLNGPPSTALKRWLYYLDQRGGTMAEDDPVLLQILREDPEIKDAEARYQQFVADDELRARYEGREKFLRDWLSLAEERRQEGLAEGREEGREQGKHEGRLLERREMLIRFVENRFGMTKGERNIVQRCIDPGLLIKALDMLTEPGATKESVLQVLK